MITAIGCTALGENRELTQQEELQCLGGRELLSVSSPTLFCVWNKVVTLGHVPQVHLPLKKSAGYVFLLARVITLHCERAVSDTSSLVQTM